MKAAANGVLNCSILDGWWVEGYSPDLGWAIGRGESYSDAGYQDHVESQALYDMLEKQIVPLFYQRTIDNLPREWIAPDEELHAEAGSGVQHQPHGARLRREVLHSRVRPRRMLAADGLATRRRAGQGQGLAPPAVERHSSIVGVHTSGNGHFKVGDNMQVEAMIDLPGVDPKELTVQLYAGPVTAQGEIERPQALAMTYARAMAPDRHVFVGQGRLVATAGDRDSRFAVLPGYQDMATPFEPGLIIWN